MLCPRCRATLEPGLSYCRYCGPPATLVCNSCGSESPAGKRFCADCGTALAGFLQDVAGATRKPVMPGPERRQLTVMFADLVGSTALGNRLDPEDLRDVITSYQNCVGAIVARFGGFVARYMGDGALIYFGFPEAREDDAERAIHTGLAVTRATCELSTAAGPPGSLACRVGIATGSVVVGDVIGVGSSLEALVVGDTPNLAARLTGVAEPGSVVISETTRQLTGQLFEYVPLPPQVLKGSTGPVRAWAVKAEIPTSSRFESLRTGNYPLFGRTEELDLLLRRWEMAQSGEGCAVLVVGEPGIGKSRLLAAFEEKVRPEPRARIRFLCSPVHQGSALFPLIKQIERAAAIQATDAANEKLRKLRMLLQSSRPAESDISLIAELLSIPVPNPRPLSSTTHLQKDVVLAAILRQFERLAAEGPQLISFEDIHWADPTTLEVLELLIERLDGLPLLLVLTTRPEFRPSWSTHPLVTYQLLGGLHRRDAGALVKAVAGELPIADELAERILERADGIPLFIEELTKTVLEAAADRKEKASHSGMAIPASLQASLMARLDRSTAAKEICQIASVIGRDFSFKLLQSLSNLPGDKLEQGLRALVSTGLATEHGEPPQSAYTFKHALVQDAAYASLLRERRRALHLRLATVFEGATDQHVLPEIIAFHFAEAGQADKAIAYYRNAAARATGRYALAERANYLRKALEQVTRLESATALHQELDLQIALYHALVDEHGSSSDELGATVERARLLCLKLDKLEELVRVHDGLFNHHFSRSEPTTLFRHAAEMREIGEKTGARQAHIMARKHAGFANLLVGNFAAACDDMRELLSIYDEVRDGYGSLAVRDPKVGAYTVLGMCLTALGDADGGARHSFEAVRYADNLNHEVSQVVALRRACVQKMMARDTEAVLHLSDRLLDLTNRFQTFKGVRDGVIFSSWARLQSGYDPMSLTKLRECLEEFDTARYWALLPFFMASAAELVARYDRREAASALLLRSGELIEITGERWAEAEVIRLKARICAETAEEQRSLLRTSWDLAKKQNAGLWSLRTATDLAELLSRAAEGEASIPLSAAGVGSSEEQRPGLSMPLT